MSIDSQSRSRSLDGLRGLAVLFVWFSHSSGRGQEVGFLDFHGIGLIGVYIFFVLSSFLLTTIVLKEGVKFSYMNYMKKRYLRIAPLFYVVVIAIFILQWWHGVNKESLWMSGGGDVLIKHLVMIKGDSIFWTIPAEFMFYFLLPPIVFFLIKIPLKWAGVICLVVSFSLFILWGLKQFLGVGIAPKVIDIQHNGQFLDVFMMGVLAGLMAVNRTFIHATLRRVLESKYVLLFGWLVVVVASFFVSRMAANMFGFDGVLINMQYLVKYQSILFALVFSLTVYNIGVGNIVWFDWGWLAFVGKVGFSWYLLHMLVLELVNNLFLYSDLVQFLISTTLLIVVCSVTYRYVELPFIKMAR